MRRENEVKRPAAAVDVRRRKVKKRDFKSRNEGIGNNRSCLDIFFLPSLFFFPPSQWRVVFVAKICFLLLLLLLSSLHCFVMLLTDVDSLSCPRCCCWGTHNNILWYFDIVYAPSVDWWLMDSGECRVRSIAGRSRSTDRKVIFSLLGTTTTTNAGRQGRYL